MTFFQRVCPHLCAYPKEGKARDLLFWHSKFVHGRAVIRKIWRLLPQWENKVSFHLGTSSVVGILPESIDRGYFAVVQKFSQERARGGGNKLLSLPSSSSVGYDNNNPNCVINSIWKQDTNEVYYMAPSAAAVCNLAGKTRPRTYREYFV